MPLIAKLQTIDFQSFFFFPFPLAFLTPACPDPSYFLLGHFDIVMLLVSHGANVNAIDKFGTTPLRIAINKERADIAAFLRENGAHLTLDVRILSKFNTIRTILTHLIIACQAGEGDNKSQQTLELCRVVFDSLDSTRKGDSIPAEALKKWLKRNAGINLRYHKQAGLEFDNLRTDNTIPWSKYSEMMLSTLTWSRYFRATS
jgi:hypothetical protein